MNANYSPVIGSWSFHVLSGTPDPIIRLVTMVETATIALEVLQRSELMNAPSIEFAAWVKWSHSRPFPRDITAMTLTPIQKMTSSHLLAMVHDYAKAQGVPDAQPSQCLITGEGIIFTPSGTRLDNLMGVTVLDDGTGATLILETYSSVWLRVAPEGVEQSDIHMVNAPRLTTALAQLSSALETDIDPQPATRYAIPTEHGLDNHRDPDGDVVYF